MSGNNQSYIELVVDESVDASVPHAARAAGALFAVRLGSPRQLQRREVSLIVRYQCLHEAVIYHWTSIIFIY